MPPETHHGTHVTTGSHPQTNKKLSFQIQKLDPFPKHSIPIQSLPERKQQPAWRVSMSVERGAVLWVFFLFEGFRRAPNQIWRWEMYLAFPPSVVQRRWIGFLGGWKREKWLRRMDLAHKHTHGTQSRLRSRFREVLQQQTETQPVVSWLRSFQLPHQWSLDSAQSSLMKRQVEPDTHLH